MSQPAWIKKYLVMKPEVTKLFEAIEAYHNYCRWGLLPFNPADVNNMRSQNWKNYLKSQQKTR